MQKSILKFARKLLYLKASLWNNTVVFTGGFDIDKEETSDKVCIEFLRSAANDILMFDCFSGSPGISV